MARKKNTNERRCPITGEEITYKGRGRPPVYSPNATAKQRKEHRAAMLTG